jgi:predicted TIM-barrel fold metal-dependent hydrolase
MLIIDSHAHLWLRQNAQIDDQVIRTTHNGRSIFFGEERQMLPPFLIDGRNSAEVFLSNMDYAQVAAAVIVQEFIDGNQNPYLTRVQHRYPQRFLTCALCDFRHPGFLPQARQAIRKGFRGIALPAHRLPVEGETSNLCSNEMMTLMAYMQKHDVLLSITLEGERQVAQMREIVSEFPHLRIAIGHFGMPTTPSWEQQILLARSPNVRIESGGITWLYNSEFYPFPSAVHALRRAIDLVGIERLMWGSDYPRTITAITYRMSYDFVSKSNAFTDNEKAAFLGGNAKTFYRFGDLPNLPYVKNMSE